MEHHKYDCADHFFILSSTLSFIFSTTVIQIITTVEFLLKTARHRFFLKEVRYPSFFCSLVFSDSLLSFGLNPILQYSTLLVDLAALLSSLLIIRNLHWWLRYSTALSLTSKERWRQRCGGRGTESELPSLEQFLCVSFICVPIPKHWFAYWREKVWFSSSVSSASSDGCYMTNMARLHFSSYTVYLNDRLLFALFVTLVMRLKVLWNVPNRFSCVLGWYVPILKHSVLSPSIFLTVIEQPAKRVFARLFVIHAVLWQTPIGLQTFLWLTWRCRWVGWRLFLTFFQGYPVNWYRIGDLFNVHG